VRFLSRGLGRAGLDVAANILTIFSIGGAVTLAFILGVALLFWLTHAVTSSPLKIFTGAAQATPVRLAISEQGGCQRRNNDFGSEVKGRGRPTA
jgi:hypothetical protein